MRHLPACRHSYFLSQMLAFDPGPRKAWREKIPQRSEDDFFPANQPHGGRLARSVGQTTIFAARNEDDILSSVFCAWHFLQKSQNEGCLLCKTLPDREKRVA